MPFDETLTPGQPGHVAVHQAIAARLNQLTDAGIIGAVEGTFAPLGGSGYVLKSAGDSTVASVEWRNDATLGYLMHLLLGATSGASAAAIAIGTDAGSGTGILISHKNAGSGLSIAHNPAASGAGQYTQAYSRFNYADRIDLHEGVRPVLIYARTGGGYADGVTTSGSNVLTSATAGFISGDVGKSISQLTSTGTVPAGVIPGGATISSVTNATTVVMSANATASVTGLQFVVADRVHGTSQVLFEILTHTQFQNVMQFRRDGENNPMFYLQENGSFNWGAGGNNGRDVNLFRQSNGQLGTDHQFIAGQGVATKVLSGAGKTTVTDGDFSRTPEDGHVVFVRNSTDGAVKMAARINGTWKYGAALT